MLEKLKTTLTANDQALLELARRVGGYDGFTSAPTNWDVGDFVMSPAQLLHFAHALVTAECNACAVAADFAASPSTAAGVKVKKLCVDAILERNNRAIGC